MRHLLTILCFLVMGWANLQAQNPPSKRVLWTENDTIQVDSLPLIIGSIQVIGHQENIDYRVLYPSSQILWISKNPRPDTLWVGYRTLSISFNLKFRNKLPSELERFSEEIPGYAPTAKSPATYESNLNTAGNLSRGIGFGNAQDVAVNSNLNLRINGVIAGDVDILAAISDDNNPIQPEGNTQQLQDFDRVFIQMKRKDLGVTLGDFEMQRSPEDYFLNYYKKSRGLHMQQGWKEKDHKIQTSLDLAVARGRFSRNLFDGLEGNRGPYRLKGSNGEIFIIIIAGTERIYLDGKLLLRGEQNDYTIDYNSGELVFMPRIVITRYSRIIAEFQYSDRNYARSVVQNRTTYSYNKTNFYLNLYREADSRNQPFQQSLEGFDSLSGLSSLDMLALSGDAPQAFIPRVIRSKVFLTDRIMYRRNTDGIYEYVNKPGDDTVYYEVAFSYLGEGKGNYRQQQSGANGRVYVYVPPVNGIKQGDHDALDVLIPPKSQSMGTIGMNRTFGNGGKLKIESAFSIEDLNLYSSLDDQNNLGGALKISWEQESRADSLRKWRFKKQLSVEHTGVSFRYIERYRDVEFNRNWNRTLQNPETTDESEQKAAETIGDIKLQAFLGDKMMVSSRTGSFIRSDIFKGISQEFTGFYQHPAFKFQGSAAGLMSETGKMFNQNFRGDARLTWVKYTWQPALYRQTEQSVFEWSDSMLPNSFYYNLTGISLSRNKSPEGFSIMLDAHQRKDRQAVHGSLNPFTDAYNLSLNLGYHFKQGDFISLTGTYRSLSFQLDSLMNENTLQARFEAGFNWFKKSMGCNTFIQTGTGQEQRREFSYLQVQSGNGVYIWNDYDSNGVQTLNEFENASELDRNRADFIRIFTPVQGFIQSIQTQFNQTLRLEPGKLTGSKHWLNRFAAVGVYTLDQKVSREAGFNPFGSIADTQMVSSTGTIRATLFFNRSSPVFGCDYNFISNQNKSLLVNGFEWRVRSEHQGRLRWNLDKRFSLLCEYKQGERIYNSDFFRNRSYRYQFYLYEPKIQYQYKSSFRTTFFYRDFNASNAAEFGGQDFKSREWGAEIKWLQAEKGNMGGILSWVETQFDGDPSTSLGYDLLQGLQPGSNWKWNLNAERRIAEKIQLSFMYDGRRALTYKPIHTGRVMARYIF